jgi:hypothetical protein
MPTAAATRSRIFIVDWTQRWIRHWEHSNKRGCLRHRKLSTGCTWDNDTNRSTYRRLLDSGRDDIDRGGDNDIIGCRDELDSCFNDLGSASNNFDDRNDSDDHVNDCDCHHRSHNYHHRWINNHVKPRRRHDHNNSTRVDHYNGAGRRLNNNLGTNVIVVLLDRYQRI